MNFIDSLEPCVSHACGVTHSRSPAAGLSGHAQAPAVTADIKHLGHQPGDGPVCPKSPSPSARSADNRCHVLLFMTFHHTMMPNVPGKFSSFYLSQLDSHGLSDWPLLSPMANLSNASRSTSMSTSSPSLLCVAARSIDSAQGRATLQSAMAHQAMGSEVVSSFLHHCPPWRPPSQFLADGESISEIHS